MKIKWYFVFKVESPSSKDVLCHVWMKLTLWFCSGTFVNFSDVFSRFRYCMSPFWKRSGSSFEQTWIPYTQGWFVSSMVEIGPVVQAEKIFKFRDKYLSWKETWRLIWTWMILTRGQRWFFANFEWNWPVRYGVGDF